MVTDMAYVSLSNDLSAVLVVYGAPQSAPTPPNYEIIADSDPRLIEFQQRLLGPSNSQIINASYNASLQRQAAALEAKGNYAAATALYLQAAGIQK